MVDANEFIDNSGIVVPALQATADDARANLEYRCALNVFSRASPVKLTSIICTIGPACTDPETLEQMMANGMTIARLNFSHGSHEYHAETVRNVRTAVESYTRRIGRTFPFAIALDTKGPEIRTGVLEDGVTAEIELVQGELISVTTDEAYSEKCNAHTLYVDYQGFSKVVGVGASVFLDDGLISLRCVSVEGDAVTCAIQNGGKLGSKKGVNLPGVAVDLPAISEKDKEDIKFAVDQDLDMIFASFIRDANGPKNIREALGDRGQDILVISKIENEQGIKNLDEIIAASDGVMVARGDMGIEIPTEKVFIAQKTMIARCNKRGMPVICATQMMESMTGKPRPTRAESNDVANAVLDGADCVMLSGETAKGQFPVQCVTTMSNICREAESAFWQRKICLDLVYDMREPEQVMQSTAIMAVLASMKCCASAIIVLTSSGKSAYAISKYRPRCPIIAVTRYPQVARQALLYRGVLPIITENESDPVWEKYTEKRIALAMAHGKAIGLIVPGSNVLVVSGSKSGPGNTNSAQILTVPGLSEASPKAGDEGAKRKCGCKKK